MTTIRRVLGYASALLLGRGTNGHEPVSLARLHVGALFRCRTTFLSQ